jgi:hypothetical protein
MCRARLALARQLGAWLAPGPLDPRPGGTIDLRFTHADRTIAAVIAAIEPPRMLEVTWSTEDEDRGFVRWKLRGEGDGTRLALVDNLPESARSFLFLAMPGWQTHIEQLAVFLCGAPTSWSWQRWQELHRDTRVVDARIASSDTREQGEDDDKVCLSR